MGRVRGRGHGQETAWGEVVGMLEDSKGHGEKNQSQHGQLLESDCPIVHSPKIHGASSTVPSTQQAAVAERIMGPASTASLKGPTALNKQ